MKTKYAILIRKGIILALCCALFFCGCQSEQDEIYSQAMASQSESSMLEPASSMSSGEASEDVPDYVTPPTPGPDARLTPAPDDDLSGELVIRTSLQSTGDHLYWLAREFMELHPNVQILLDYDRKNNEYRSSAESKMKKNSFYTNLRMEIASGEADYLIYSATLDMDFTPLARSGLLEDLWTYWENDPDIRDEDYFLPVIESFEVDGMLPVLPYSFYLTGGCFNKSYLEELGVDLSVLQLVDSDVILDWYERLRETHPDLQLFFTAPGKDGLFVPEIVNYIDLESNTASFDSPEFLTFLERTQDVINDEPIRDIVGWGNSYYMEMALHYGATGEITSYFVQNTSLPQIKNVVTKSRDSFCTTVLVNIYDTISMFQQSYDYLAGPYPVLSTNGHLGIYADQGEFMMPASMKNKELAWEFMKYCISEREDLTFNGYDDFPGTDTFFTSIAIPVNKPNYGRMAEESVEQVKFVNGNGYEVLDFEPVNGEEIVAFMDEVLSHSPVNIGKYNVDVQEFLDEYYVNELITAQECADKIQGRVEIWLNE